MAKVRIPDQVKPGLIELSKLTQNNFDGLIDFVRNAKAEFKPDILLVKLKSYLKDVNEQEIEHLLKTLISVFSFFETTNKTATQIIQDLVNAILSDEITSDCSDEQISLLETRLTALLAINSPFKLSSKAVTLVRDYERIYLDARIINDIRPVISKKHEKTLTGALILHTLKIEYQDINGTQELYIALDTNDIQNLRKKLEEAEDEINTIKKIINQADIIYLDSITGSD